MFSKHGVNNSQHKPNTRRKGVIKLNTLHLVLIAGLILVAGYFMFWNGATPTPLNQSPFGTTTVTSTVGGQTQPSNTNYAVGVTYTEANSKSGSSISTTSAAIRLYHSNGARLSSLATLYGQQGASIASGTTATQFTVYPADNGYLFLYLSEGTAHYPDPSVIMASNSYISGCAWKHVTSNTVSELVCEVEIARLGVQNYQGGAGVSALLMQIRIAGIPVDNVATLSAPADVTGSTTSGTDVYITWTFTNLADNSAHGFAKIWITSNQTTAYGDVQDITISNDGGIVTMSTVAQQGDDYILNSPFISSTAGGVAQTWRFFPLDKDQATEYSQALLISRGTSDSDSITVKLHLKTYFAAANDGITAVLNYRFIGANNTLVASASDSVKIVAA